MRRFAPVLLALVIQPQPSCAQAAGTPPPQPTQAESLTVDQAVELALRDNPTIRAAQRRVYLAQTKVAPARALNDPMLMVRDWGTPLKKPWDLNQAQLMLGFQQTLTSRDKRDLRGMLAETDARAAADELESVRQQVAAEVRQLSAALLRNGDELRLHEDQARLLNQAAAAELASYTTGRSPQTAVLRAQLAVTRLGDHMIQLQQEGDAARAELNVLLGREPASEIAIFGSYGEQRKLPPVDELQRIALANRPELANLREQITKAADSSRLARLALKPDYTIAAGYMLMPSGSTYRNGYMAELTMNLPRLNRARHDAETASADAAAEVSRAELDARASAIFLEVRQAQLSLRSAQERARLYHDTLLPQAQAAFKSSTTAYETAHNDFASVIEAENLLLDIQTNYYQSLAAAEVAAAQLERAIGAPLPGTPSERTSK